MTSKTSHNIETIWTLPVRKKQVFTLRINRRMALTLILSILLHLALLWLFAPKIFSMGAPEKDAPQFEVSLGPPQKKQTAPSEEVLPDRRPLPKPPKVKPKVPKPAKKKKPKSAPVKVVKESKTKIVKKQEINKKRPEPMPAPTSPDPLPGEDMQSHMRRIREAKLAKQGLSKHDIEEVLASSNPKSDGDRRDAKIRENLNLDGTNGIFAVRSLNVHRAQFSFKGWKNNINTARLEIINVKTPDGTDIKKAVIRKMIAIIRREYSGDFKWDSRRLNRVVELSARQADTQALEAFMMLEIFGPGMPYANF